MCIYKTFKELTLRTSKAAPKHLAGVLPLQPLASVHMTLFEVEVFRGHPVNNLRQR